MKFKVKTNTIIDSKKDFERPKYKNIEFFLQKENLKTLNPHLKKNLIKITKIKFYLFQLI